MYAIRSYYATLAEQKLGDQAYWLQGEGGLRLLMAVSYNFV